MRIREVVKETGVSRELIHHYLRQGLLPKPEQKAEYSRQHVLLLRLLKRLREDHHLPLEVIRGVFEIFDFDPAHLEPFTLADSLNNRLTSLTNGGDIFSASLPAGEIVNQLGISPDRLHEYVEAKLLRPVKRGDEDRFSVYDMNIIALCERGTQLGIPFHSLRNISAYVRVAFELEHKYLFEVARQESHDRKKALSGIFVRQEIITRFIQNLVQSQICHRLTDLITLGREIGGTLDTILFRPSAVFCRRHGLEKSIEVAQEALCERPGDPGLWRRTARLMLHAGRYREASFFLEQALHKWPDDPSLLSLDGRALILSGSLERGADLLKIQVASASPDPLSCVFLALCLLHSAQEATGDEPLISQALELQDLIKLALESAQQAPWEVRTEVRMIAGWVLHSVPSSLQQSGEGIGLLTETYDSLKQGQQEDLQIPGLKERFLINTAYLLFRCSGDTEASKGNRSTPGRLPAPEELRTLICNLDPAGAFAEKIFLETNDVGA